MIAQGRGYITELKQVDRKQKRVSMPEAPTRERTRNKADEWFARRRDSPRGVRPSLSDVATPPSHLTFCAGEETKRKTRGSSQIKSPHWSYREEYLSKKSPGFFKRKCSQGSDAHGRWIANQTPKLQHFANRNRNLLFPAIAVEISHNDSVVARPEASIQLVILITAKTRKSFTFMLAKAPC